jgi:hypothetical protein
LKIKKLSDENQLRKSQEMRVCKIDEKETVDLGYRMNL